MLVSMEISDKDRNYVDLMRGISITRVVLVHLGLSWFYPPYSQFINVFLPVLFFVSGGVTFFSFKRATNISTFLSNRLISIFVPYLLIIGISFLTLWLYQLSVPSFNLSSIVSWITFNPTAVRDTMPYPLGQVWFLHALVLIIITAPITFTLAIKNPFWLLVPVLISITLGLVQHFFDIGRNMFLLSHNLYQPLVNMGFFMLGAFFYTYKHWFTTRKNLLFMVFFLCMGVLSGILQPQDMLMSKHTYAPDFYYLMCSFSAIFLFLTMQDPITWICEKIKPLKIFFLFISKHSYCVFLLHSLVLIKIHTWFELDNVIEDPKKAFIKIVLVLFFTCVLAYPFSLLAAKITKWVKPKLMKKNQPAHSGMGPSVK